ncbi:MAG: sel1 repeat family protein [Clostridia bacterium]|nr:sel1 repeat family protein [Clostridia bacterium]
MIICKKCGYEALIATECCQRCGANIQLSEREISEYLEKLELAKRKKEYEAYVEYSKILAWAGRTESEREYGRMLELGDLVERNYDEAMRFFYRAAKKHDAFAAYRYSRLVSRANEEKGKLWLLYSALLGCPDAYPDAAEQLSKDCFEADANHFYILSAKHDDVDSIVEMASRYYKGVGVSPSLAHAKWYMEKLRIPPLYALKLAYKLKGILSEEPPEELYDKEPLIKRLMNEASRLGLKEVYFKLTEMLAELENIEAMTVLGTLLADGIGCEEDVDEAVTVFTKAAVLGSADAYICLSKIFLSDEYSERSPELAIRYLEGAFKLESSDAAFILGEIYEDGAFVERDFKKAEFYFRKAADGGNGEAEIRVRKIVETRNKFFDEAASNEKAAPEKAFKAYAIAAAMGHKNAPLKLADAYLRGNGVKQDRSAAYFWYSEAAALGDDKALCPLGLCYALGIGVNRDFKLAKATLMKALKLGSEGAKRALSALYDAKKLKLARKLYSRAMRLIYKKKFTEAKLALECAAELDSLKSCYILGCFYEFGLGVESDREKAREYYKSAYVGGFLDRDSKYKKLILKLIR